MRVIHGGLRRATRQIGFVKRAFNAPSLPREDGKLLIHIGCGEIDSPEFVNVDAQPYPHVHHVTDDMTNLSMFGSNTADLIYACHVFEHVPRKTMTDVLGEMRRVLKPDGVLRIAVPDFDCMVDIYLKEARNVDAILSPLMGSHANPFDVHFWAFNQKSLTAELTKAGFREVRRWDPRHCAHHDFEDWASRPIEHEGRAYPISLNLEALK